MVTREWCSSIARSVAASASWASFWGAAGDQLARVALGADDMLGQVQFARDVSFQRWRSLESKKQLIRLLFERLGSAPLGIAAEDLELTISETPRASWGIRGLPGNELGLSYKVDV